MTEVIRDDHSILYVDDGGNGSLILRFEMYPNGWLLTGFDRCAGVGPNPSPVRFGRREA
ncbi:MAG: hypothetical protein AAF962_25360 [Actinomycetota bacterium]